eukprot:Lithocolla_globosa_v1_NODE_1516_length_2518_cov_51.211125.p3 type:complete len:112 gc:universal NODE_1516_length_2518_cov_51.211125:1633-1968(+)
MAATDWRRVSPRFSTLETVTCSTTWVRAAEGEPKETRWRIRLWKANSSGLSAAGWKDCLKGSRDERIPSSLKIQTRRERSSLGAFQNSHKRPALKYLYKTLSTTFKLFKGK